jgi:hypothetical protein
MAVSFKLPSPSSMPRPARLEIIPALPRLDFAVSPTQYPQVEPGKKKRVKARDDTAPSLEVQCSMTQTRDGEFL